MQGIVIAAPASARPVVLRDFTPVRVVTRGRYKPQVLIHGVQGPKGAKGDPGDSSAIPQPANTVSAGPVSGDDALPTYRKLQSADFAGVVFDGGNF